MGGHGFQYGEFVCGYRGLVRFNTSFAQSTLLPVVIVSVTDGAELYSTLKKLVYFTKTLEYLVVLNLNKVSQLFAHLYLTLCFKYV